MDALGGPLFSHELPWHLEASRLPTSKVRLAAMLCQVTTALCDGEWKQLLGSGLKQKGKSLIKPLSLFL